MVENQEFKQRTEKNANNSSDSALESASSKAKSKLDNQVTAGSLIDNFGSEE